MLRSMAVDIQIHVTCHSCAHAVHCWCLWLLMAVGGGWQWWEAAGLTIDGVVMVVGVEVRECANMSDLG
jgi:hypothetical protein